MAVHFENKFKLRFFRKVFLNVEFRFFSINSSFEKIIEIYEKIFH
jgi:hypothetical protein